MTSIAARCRPLLTCLVAVAATAATATPATASVTAAAVGCPDVALTQPFTPWGDGGDYFLAPDGGLEQGGASWTLRGLAEVTAGNEPFQVGGAGDDSSLRLRAGSSATTAPFCIGVEHRAMRFFAAAGRAGSLAVDVLYADRAGRQRSMRIATVDGSDGWAASDAVPMIVNELAGENNAMSVSLRFSPQGVDAWTIDDVYVDPYRGR